MSLFSANAQEKKRDTLVTTEVVNIITRYNPKIAAAKKIAKNPTNTLLEKNLCTFNISEYTLTSLN